MAYLARATHSTPAFCRRDQENEKLAKQMAILRDANLDSVETLFDDMITEDAEMAKLRLVRYWGWREEERREWAESAVLLFYGSRCLSSN